MNRVRGRKKKGGVKTHTQFTPPPPRAALFVLMTPSFTWCALKSVSSWKWQSTNPGVGGGGGGHSPHILVGMWRGKVFKKMGVSGTNTGHSGTIGIREVSGTWHCENAHALPMDGRVWLAAGGDKRLKRKEILITMVSGTTPPPPKKKKSKFCLSTKHCDALERNIFSFVRMNGNLGLKLGVARAAHT